MQVKIFRGGDKNDLEKLINDWFNSKNSESNYTKLIIHNITQSSTYIAHEKISKITISVFYEMRRGTI